MELLQAFNIQNQHLCLIPKRRALTSTKAYLVYKFEVELLLVTLYSTIVCDVHDRDSLWCMF